MDGRLTNSRVPTYVNIYNSIYLDITNGVYQQGEYLPSESILAEKYNVSRNTLRQALAILNEDGLIVKTQGRGTKVAVRSDDEIYDKKANPMIQFAKTAVDDIKIHYNFAAPTDIAINKMGLSKSDIVLASDIVYCSEGRKIGYSFIQVTMQAISELSIDVSQEAAIYDLLVEMVYQKAAKQELVCKLVYANESEAKFLQVAEEEPLLLIETLLYEANHEPYARCKYYFRPEHYKIRYSIS